MRLGDRRRVERPARLRLSRKQRAGWQPPALGSGEDSHSVPPRPQSGRRQFGVRSLDLLLFIEVIQQIAPA
jgi:hypothetical protein